MSGIDIHGLEFEYGGQSTFRLQIRELRLEPGECVAIVGPSGSGKSTLLNLVAGTLLPAVGDIRVGDIRVNALGETERRRYRVGQVGQVFQAFELLEYLTVKENVLLPRYIDPSTPLDADARQRASELLASVGLAGKESRRPSRLSHGERQRVAVCRALLNRPSLLLADEPTGNLDQDNKQNVVKLLIEQARAHASTLLMVTHDRSLLDSFERIVDFNDLAWDKA
ncbi:MAG: ABC transporter ATP-binding protein [Xanthomonadales bacterium]|jgi:putative ABC transport system ATP-binding protein|nr:ABC transporter ATP-binding protein [Xanthomonadales bacterium]MDH3925497.1 ABC transporter ATP-binding protein [Xanthomonadales bacterium]MDH3941667.1 ABC transporter ATP-binding protein [Xanthomonadales bacterium]MDH3993275.1 ABC transporter ATP-binding protein [Gammaproteobacteria bacterium]